MALNVEIDVTVNGKSIGTALHEGTALLLAQNHAIANGGGEYIFTVSIPNHSFHIALTPSGVVNSRYPDGNDGTPAIPLTWATIPSSLNNAQGTPVTITLRASYLAEPGSPSATLSLASGVLPSGWALGADSLTFSGTGSGSALIQIAATRLGFVAVSGVFKIESLAAPSADITAPTIIAGIAVQTTSAGGGTNTITFDPSMDPSVPGYLTSGLKDYRLYRDGVLSATTASPSAGISPTFTYADIGSVGVTGSASQSTTDWSITAEGLGFSGTADRGGFLGVSVVGDFTANLKIGSFSGPASQSAVGLMFREDLTAGSRNVFVKLAPQSGGYGVQTSARTANGGATTNLSANRQGVFAPAWLKLAKVGTTVTTYYSTDGGVWLALDSITLPGATSGLIGVGIASIVANSTCTANAQQLCVQNIAAVTFTDASVGVGVTHAYTVRARDINLSESADSKSVSITTPAAVTLPDAPRYGIIAVGLNNASTATQSNANRIARFDIAAMGLNYEGVGAQLYTGSVDGFLGYIQGQSTCGTLFFNYMLPDSMGVSGHADYPQFATIVNTMNWTLYRNGSSGTKSVNYFKTSWGINNSIAAYTPADSGGLHLEDRATKFHYEYHFTGVQGGANQSKDFSSRFSGIFHDNGCMHIPTGGYNSVSSTYQADYTRDGTPDYQTQVGPPSGATLDLNYKISLALGPAWLAANAPSKYMIANLAVWGDPGMGSNAAGCKIGGTDATGFDQVFHGGLIENLYGLRFSEETFAATVPDPNGGFRTAKNQYQFAMAHTKAPKFTGPAIYWRSNGFDYLNQTVAWQGPRYQFGCCFMDDGYAWIGGLNSTYDGGIYDVTSLAWLDEMTADPATLICTGEANQSVGKGWMGQRIDQPWTILGNGAYAVRYTKGGNTNIVFVNPPDAQRQFNIATYFPGLRLQLLTGTQSPSVNSGAIVTSLNMLKRSAQFGRLVV